MFSGITGKDFQSAEPGLEVRGTEVVVEISVEAGVIGEYFFGLGVAVGRGADDLLSKSSAGNVCVAPLTGITTDSAVALPLQAVIKTLTIKARNNKRFTRAKYSGGKLGQSHLNCLRREL